jgi:hypothetical protein
MVKRKNKGIILKTTLFDLLSDLSFTNGEYASRLEKNIKTKSNSDLLKDISDYNSELCSIIVDCNLHKTEDGLKYIQIFSLYQPNFVGHSEKTTLEINDVTPQEQSPNIPNSTAVEDGPCNVRELINNSQMSSSLKNIFTNESNKELMDLTSELTSNVFQEMNLTEENFQPENIMNLMTNLGGFVKNKMDSGTIDFNRLESQASNLCSNLSESEEIRQVLETNPQLASILDSLSAASSTLASSNDVPVDENVQGPALPDLSGFFNAQTMLSLGSLFATNNGGNQASSQGNSFSDMFSHFTSLQNPEDDLD